MVVNAIIVNRNLVTSLKNTINFLKKDPRVHVTIYDHDSNYKPLLDYYDQYDGGIIRSNDNAGPYKAWSNILNDKRSTEYFIVADPDCDYSSVPDDWLDRMIYVLKNSSIHKVGFSLDLDSVLDTNPLKSSILHEQLKFWEVKNEFGWDAKIDTTFALYRSNAGFRYDATRLDKPYCITHIPWTLDYNNLNDEWRYYIDNANKFSTWGAKIKNIRNK